MPPSPLTYFDQLPLVGAPLRQRIENRVYDTLGVATNRLGHADGLELVLNYIDDQEVQARRTALELEFSGFHPAAEKAREVSRVYAELQKALEKAVEKLTRAEARHTPPVRLVR